MKISDICRTILNVLADTDGHPLAEDILQDHVNVRLRPKPPQADFDDAMMRLKSAGHINQRAADFGDDHAKWLITEKGESWLDR